jgi:hypothetical protein
MISSGPEVGVPVTWVINTLVPWLCWMIGSYVGHLSTKMTFLNVSVLNRQTYQGGTRGR